jgi:hypothetical protein
VLGYGHPVAWATAWQIVSQRYLGGRWHATASGHRGLQASRGVSARLRARDRQALAGRERVRMAGTEDALARFQQQLENCDRVASPILLSRVVRGAARATSGLSCSSRSAISKSSSGCGARGVIAARAWRSAPAGQDH